MLQYKTTCIPSLAHKVSKAEFEEDITLETGNKVIAPIGAAIEAEAKGGWTLHSISLITQRFRRRKTILETLFGWLCYMPIVGGLFFPKMYEETKKGHEKDVFILVFVKES